MPALQSDVGTVSMQPRLERWALRGEAPSYLPVPGVVGGCGLGFTNGRQGLGPHKPRFPALPGSLVGALGNVSLFLPGALADLPPCCPVRTFLLRPGMPSMVGATTSLLLYLWLPGEPGDMSER